MVVPRRSSMRSERRAGRASQQLTATGSRARTGREQSGSRAPSRPRFAGMRIRENRPIPAKARFGPTVTIWSDARRSARRALTNRPVSDRRRDTVASVAIFSEQFAAVTPRRTLCVERLGFPQRSSKALLRRDDGGRPANMLRGSAHNRMSPLRRFLPVMRVFAARLPIEEVRQEV